MAERLTGIGLGTRERRCKDFPKAFQASKKTGADLKSDRRETQLPEKAAALQELKREGL